MFAVIYLPDFSLQAVMRHEPELYSRPVVLIDDGEKKAPVFQMTSIARASGVKEGLTSTQALARCGNVLIKSRSLTQEQATNEILLQTAFHFSPRIEATANGVCTLDLQGLPEVGTSRRDVPARVVAGGTVIEQSSRTERVSSLHATMTVQRAVPTSADKISAALWAEKILTAFAQLNLRARIGIAETPSLAFHAARETKAILLVENSGEFISSLPIERLEPAPEILSVLNRWGIHTIGEFVALGKNNIAERLGAEALELFDRASTSESRPLQLVIPSETFEESADFEIEIESLEPLLFILQRFVEQLCRRMELSQFVVEELKLQLKLSSGEKYESLFHVPSPTGNKTTLFRMLQTHLETVRTDSPIVALQLSAKPCRSQNHQFGLFEVALRDPNQFEETLARLNALCGAGRVGTPVRQNTHQPDTFHIQPPKFESSSLPTSQSALRTSIGLRLRRFRPAFHADVFLKNEKPSFINSLKLNSPIKNVSGPWRTSGDWWEKKKFWNRDEWDIQTQDGALYRIYHENKDWFLEGVYD